MQPKPATLDTIGGRPVLRFERLLRHSPEKVWKAVTDPAELAHWFPARIETELRVGAPMRFVFEEGPVTEDLGGEIIELDPPKVFAYRWGEDVLRWELVPEAGGCRLHFSHALSDAQGGLAAAARNAAGWDSCLAALSARLDGRPAEGLDGMLARIESYVERFGLDRGQVLDRQDGHLVRFERDLVWARPDNVWATLTGKQPAVTGERPPPAATDDAVPAGAVTASESPYVLEYEWLHDGSAAGRVRWEIIADPVAGTRVVLTQTVPPRPPDLPATALAAWQRKLDELFEAVFSEAWA